MDVTSEAGHGDPTTSLRDSAMVSVGSSARARAIQGNVEKRQ